MYDLIRITNATGIAFIDINDDNFYPVELFTWTPLMVGEQRAKLKGWGRHRGYRDIEAMDIQIEGHIKANSTDEYWVARKALLNIIIPDPEQIAPAHGFIQFKINGDNATYYQAVHLESYEVPTVALYPTVTEFRLEYEGLDGAWRNLANDQIARI